LGGRKFPLSTGSVYLLYLLIPPYLDTVQKQPFAYSAIYSRLYRASWNWYDSANKL